jgi:hypothetical protein
MQACRQGTLLVELGFRTGYTRHYANAALALGMTYQLVHLQSDSLDRGIGVSDALSCAL